jgi:hypothetical protein
MNSNAKIVAMSADEFLSRAEKMQPHKQNNGVDGRLAPSRQKHLGLDAIARTGRTSLNLPDSLPIGIWQRIGEQILLIADSSAWWIGDWLIYGQETYPDRYRLVLEKTGLHYQTLRNYAWVARRFNPSRRRDALSFQHHAELAALAETEQDGWLDQAEQRGWSRNELRKRLRKHRSAGGSRCDDQDTPGVLEILHIELHGARRDHWQTAASQADCHLTDWIIQVVDRAAEQLTTAAADDQAEINGPEGVSPETRAGHCNALEPLHPEISDRSRKNR